MANVYFVPDGSVCFDSWCRLTPSRPVDGEGKRDKNGGDRPRCFSFYCIRRLTTILIGENFIYTDKWDLITRGFRLVRKQRIFCFECF